MTQDVIYGITILRIRKDKPMKQKKPKMPKHRNEHAVAARFRTSAGPMEKTKKAKRRQDKIALRKQGKDYFNNSNNVIL